MYGFTFLNEKEQKETNQLPENVTTMARALFKCVIQYLQFSTTGS